MKMISIGGMLCMAAMTLCSMSIEGGDDLAGAGPGAVTNDDPPTKNLAESEGAQQNETDGAAENQDGESEAEVGEDGLGGGEDEEAGEEESGDESVS